jgi:hypothetical protein
MGMLISVFVFISFALNGPCQRDKQILPYHTKWFHIREMDICGDYIIWETDKLADSQFAST